MKIQGNNASNSGFWMGLLVLALGVGIGFLVGNLRSAAEVPTSDLGEMIKQVTLQIPVAPAEVPEEPPVNDLKTIYIDIDEAASQRLQEVYDRSMLLHRIVQTEGDLVPAVVRSEGKVIDAFLRIKGDFNDHIDTDKWSFRIELESDKLYGMSRFSIQHPKTRNYLYEWLHMEMARREGLLAPRTDFVNVVVNGNSTGIYYLEEHFTKELIESQGRREGPIVRFVEDTFLDMESQYIAMMGYAPESVLPARRIERAQVAAYGEKRLNQSENLARQLQQALDLMRDIQLDRNGMRTHELLDIDSNTTMYALASLFRTSHGANWKSRRYYHNPVTGRLEPVIFDTGAGVPLSARDPRSIFQYVLPAYLKNDYFYNSLFAEIGRVSTSAYIEECLAELRPKLEHFEELLRLEGLDDPLMNTEAIVAELREQQVFLNELVHPRMPVGFDCTLLTKDAAGATPSGDIEIEAWATTSIPVVVKGFLLENGRYMNAQDLRVRGHVTPTAGDRGAVTLPKDGSHVFFTFSGNDREAVLKDLDELKKAVLSSGEPDRSLKITLKAEYRLISDDQATEVELPIRKFAEVWREEGGRPETPSLDEALEEHSFLRYDQDQRRLEIVPGVHDVAGDLVVPVNYPLYAGPGVHLRFGETAALVTSSPIFFEGSADDPIVLEPQPGASMWGGLAVIEPGTKSIMRQVTVRNTNVIRRGGWMMTGGINFYHAPVDIFDSRFENALGEDALNIFGAEFLLDGIVIDTVASDAFDGDFVTGLVVRSHFLSSVEDAVDVSGSKIMVRDCKFTAIGDKGISAGENSQVSVRDCTVESASIAVASKDFSQVDVDGLVIESAKFYGFAVYIKKAEFGPSSVVAKNVTLGELGLGTEIVQETCSFSLDGESVAGVPLDVKELYRQKILGQ
ncbi:MAG: CotH kinase family protein [Planctomycetota bacterium]|nr:CotH kinase family protein [Planctomycetota bacterium]